MSESKDKNISPKKDFFIKYGTCVGFLSVFFVLLFYVTIKANGAWGKHLKVSVENCLEEKMPGTWAVCQSIDIKNPYSTNIACYQTLNPETNEFAYSVITRVMTYFGPVNCVFLCKFNGEVTLVGFSSVHGRILEQLNDSKVSTKIKFFSERLPLILDLPSEKSSEEK